ncbi:TPA: DMT family transporter [Streptococcus suis]
MKETLKGYLYTIFAAIAWGFSGICGEILLKSHQVDAGWLTSVRMLIAGVCLLAYVWIKPNIRIINLALVSKKGNWLTLFAFAVFGLFMLQYPFIMAIQHSNAGTATMLQYLGPGLIVFYMCAKDKRLPHIIEVVALVFTLIGTAVMATDGQFSNLSLSPATLFWGLASALGILLYTVIPMRLIAKYNATVVITYGFLIGGLITGIGFQIWEKSVGYDLNLILLVVLMSVVGTVLAFAIYLEGVAIIGPIRASMIACLEPVSAVFFSVIFLGHRFRPMELIGMVLLLLGVTMISLKDMQLPILPILSKRALPLQEED